MAYYMARYQAGEILNLRLLTMDNKPNRGAVSP
jgi:hypothetical protein